MSLIFPILMIFITERFLFSAWRSVSGFAGIIDSVLATIATLVCSADQRAAERRTHHLSA